MHTHVRLIALAALTVVLCGCYRNTTVNPHIDEDLVKREQLYQKTFALERRLGYEERAESVGLRILQAGMPFCRENWNYAQGVKLTTIDSIEDDWKQAYIDYFDLPKGRDNYVFVESVQANGPADKAGLKPGMIVLAVNGNEFPDEGWDWKHEVADICEEASDKPRVVFTVQDKGKEKKLSIHSVKVCDYDVKYSDKAEMNAFANGEEIIICKGIIKEFPDDSKLALIVGHELGHNIAGHIDQNKAAINTGLFVDILITGLTGVSSNAGVSIANQMNYSNSIDHEKEADYLGMYFAYRGGYEVQDAADVWRGMGAESPYAISHDTTHPNSASRYVYLNETYDEIMTKERHDEVILPNLTQEALDHYGGVEEVPYGSPRDRGEVIASK